MVQMATQLVVEVLYVVAGLDQVAGDLARACQCGLRRRPQPPSVRPRIRVKLGNVFLLLVFLRTFVSARR